VRKRILVSITLEDIQNGIRGHPSACAAVLALHRALLEQEPSLLTAGLGCPLNRAPRALLKFMLDFDAGRPVSPATFELETADFCHVTPERP
jgi:hypothetical protein